MDFHEGDYVTRISHNHDIVFKIVSIDGNIAFLKGADLRLYADSLLSDLVKTNVSLDSDKQIVEKSLRSLEMDRSQYFYLPGKILHIDGDSDYLKRCMDYYRENHILAVGKKIDEEHIANDIVGYLEEVKPDIVIITGHDAYMKKMGDKKDLKNYKNSTNFVGAVKNARKYEKSHEKLIIIAGACQSNYEELIKAGANFASSPKRVNIHALDPAIIACNLALTERNKEINLIELLSKTKNGVDGMGGLICNGMMYVGYPR